MISTIAISRGYLYRRPRPHFSTGWGAASWNGSVGLSICAGSTYSTASLRVGSLVDSSCKYGLTTVD
jgi:hypothetical protein